MKTLTMCNFSDSRVVIEKPASKPAAPDQSLESIKSTSTDLTGEDPKMSDLLKNDSYERLQSYRRSHITSRQDLI